MNPTWSGYFLFLFMSTCFVLTHCHKRAIGKTYTTYQKGVTCNATGIPFVPKSLHQIQDLVRHALENNLKLKALGNLYSATDIICTTGIPIQMKYINHFQYNPNTNFATVGAGLTIKQFLENLHKLGRTVYGIPTYGDITIGGAIGTGAHGTSYKNPATLSDIFVGIVVVDGLGQVKNITDKETLRAFRTHLGLLGIIYEVVFPTVEQYKLYARYHIQSDNVLRKSNMIHRLLVSNDRFHFHWFPTSKQVVLYEANRVPLSTPGNCQTHFHPEVSSVLTKGYFELLENIQEEMNHLGAFALQHYLKMRLYQNVPGVTPMFSQFSVPTQACQNAVGYNHRMISNTCKHCSWDDPFPVHNFDFAVNIPLDQLESAMQTMTEILEEYSIEFPLIGILFRFLPKGDGLMSLNGDRDSVGIEWVFAPRADQYNKPMLGLPVAQAMMQALMNKHQGRAHWGKGGLVYTQKQFVEKAYSHLPSFIKRMHEFDPHGIFLNDFANRLKSKATKTALDSYAQHCALVDSCICQNDNDCGDNRPRSYYCGNLKGYNVCKERPIEFRSVRAKWFRSLIKSIVRY